MSHKPEFHHNEGTTIEKFLDLLQIENPHPSSVRFYELLLESAWLHARKQEDYGSAEDPFNNLRSSKEFGVPGWKGTLVRMNDKVSRLKSFALKGSLANESAEDSMRDIAVYALIALVMYEEDSRPTQEEMAKKALELGNKLRGFPETGIRPVTIKR